jgi:prepilin-type N-terminal cleavage/methylation domain-containing protein
MQKQKTRGFTIIELIVVIVIIAVLVAIVISSVTKYQIKSRDIKRIADLEQINLAIKMYYSIRGYYPICSTYILNGNTDCLSLALISENIMTKLPIDPRTPAGATAGVWGRDYQYESQTNPSKYYIRGSLEGTLNSVTVYKDYPSAGTQCDALPDCPWFSSCVYRGYGSGCQITIQYGSD